MISSVSFHFGGTRLKQFCYYPTAIKILYYYEFNNVPFEFGLSKKNLNIIIFTKLWNN